ncbi:S8 family peptidase [Phocaeicola oris]|uniref:S8 family peptidase n=1 Tax=Phocaeicola oris TaxID=2896850 RepID=UPI0038B3AAC9
MSLKKFIFVVTLLMGICSIQAQKATKYRIYLKDKLGTLYTFDKPEEYLSPKALERRVKQDLPIDSTDLPVSRQYIDRIQQVGVQLVSQSKWNNTVLIQTTDSVLINRIVQLPFVSHIKKVWIAPDSVPERDKTRKDQIKKHLEKTDSYYGDASIQIAVHHGDSLHLAGFKGEGMTIGVIDAGFFNADAIPVLKHLNLLGTKDFVNPRSDIYAEHYHGMMVLSCMAANTPKVMVGTAPEASYWLLRSEDYDTEQPVEEDYWAAAVEFADSVGVDVINTSLGYDSFDEPFGGYEYKQLDGHYSLMSNSASLVAKKGMILVCSAGNSGSQHWKKITPPGDAEDVITVGAIDRDGVNANFSSVGNTADGRVKPDVMAIGVFSSVLGTDGQPSHGNGTSFASPTFCGLVACFWQACPHLTAKQVIEAVRQCSDRVDFPDNIYGYGVPDIWKAYLKNKK